MTLYESESGTFNVALGGDFILTRRLAVFQEERFLKLREILRGADVSFVNFESTFHEYLEGHHNLAKGTYITTEPSLIEDMKWFGIKMVACPGSHAFDYGEEGIILTNKYLNQAGIVHAGTGQNLREARSPSYLETARGRIALLGVTGHIFEWAIAGEQRPDTPGRAGVNPLRYETTYVVDRKTMQYLRHLGSVLGVEAAKERYRDHGSVVFLDTRDQYEFLGHIFVIGEDFAIRTRPNEEDLEANLRQIREAKRMADWVIVSLHYHEMGGPTLLTAQVKTQLEEPADFVKEFAHRCIDEGADIIACHGPQIPLGIEVYKEKPVFYSLGSLVFQLETMRYLPQEAYSRYGLDLESTPSDFTGARYQNDSRGHPANPLQWQQVLAVCHFQSGILKQILLHPLDLGYGKPRSQRGRPMLADEDLGKRIIDRVAQLSIRLGTEVSFSGGQGVITMM